MRELRNKRLPRRSANKKNNDPLEKAAKAALAVGQELAKVHVMQLDVSQSRATRDQKELYKKKFDKMEKDLGKARDRLNPATPDTAELCMQEAEALKQKVRDLKSEVKLMQRLANACV